MDAPLFGLVDGNNFYASCERVLDPLAMGVLQGTFKEHDAVRGEVRDGALVLTAAAASEVAG